MASVRYGTDRPEAPVQRASSPQWLSAPNGLPDERDDLASELRGLYEQLLAARTDLGAGSSSGNTPPTLSRGEFDCVLAQLDCAIVAARGLLCSGRSRATSAITIAGRIDASRKVSAAPA